MPLEQRLFAAPALAWIYPLLAGLLAVARLIHRANASLKDRPRRGRAQYAGGHQRDTDN